MPKACSVIKKETLTQVFSCELACNVIKKERLAEKIKKLDY